MLSLSRIVKLTGIAVLLCIAMPVFAEDAPVYDVDSMSSPVDRGIKDQGADQDQTAPPDEGDITPPAPSSPQDNSTFIPSEPEQSMPQPEPASPAAPISTRPLSMDQRVKRAEQQIANLQNSDLPPRLNSLQNEVQSLRSQVEGLTRQLQVLQTQQKAMFSDIDTRLSKQAVPASSASKARTTTSLAANDKAPTDSKALVPLLTKPAASTPAPVKPAIQPNVAEEQQIYQTAYGLIKQKKYNDAVDALQKMLQKYPTGQFAANAHYWLGELYGLMAKNDQALTEFNVVVQKFPDSPRVADAQLKVGLIYAAQFKWTDAKSSFKKIINHYPGTASARLASEQLKQIKQAGH